METYILTENSVKKFIPLVVNPKEDVHIEVMRTLDELIPKLNRLNDSLEAYFEKQMFFRKIEGFIKTRKPEDEIRKEYALIQREKNKALQDFTLEKTMELLEYPDFNGVLNALSEVRKTLSSLNQIDSHFSNNLVKFWNGSRFYFNKEEYEKFYQGIVPYTKSHAENLWMTKVLNICESLNTLAEIGLKVGPATLPNKLSMLITSIKTEKNGTIVREFQLSPKIFDRLSSRHPSLRFDKSMVYGKVPEDKAIDNSSLLVGEYSDKINQVFELMRSLSKGLNELNELLDEFYGIKNDIIDIQEIFNLDLAHDTEFEKLEYFLRQKYIQKKGIKIPGVPMKMDKLVEMVDVPEHDELRKKVKEVYSAIMRLREDEFAFSPGDISNLWVQGKNKFEVTPEIGQRINQFYTHHTHGYYDNIVLFALRQFAESLNDLARLGHKIDYAMLPLKLKSLLLLDKERGEIMVKPNIFDNENLKNRVKGLADPEYRFGVSKNEEQVFFDVSIFS